MNDQSPRDFRARAHSAAERTADLYVHGAGVGAALAGAGVLIAIASEQGDGAKLTAIIAYAAGLCFMLIASAAYNLGYGSRFRDLFRWLDHAAIFVMIAGTCTPFVTQFYSGFRSGALALGLWAMCLGCIAWKLFAAETFERVSVLLYLVFGWGAAATLAPIMTRLPPFALTTLVLGGVLYTVGVIFHLRQSLPFHNAIWHGFVLLAAASQYGSVLSGVVWPRA